MGLPAVNFFWCFFVGTNPYRELLRKTIEKASLTKTGTASFYCDIFLTTAFA